MRRHCKRSEATHSPSAPYEWIASSLRSSQRRDNPVDLERRILNLNREGSEDRTLTPRAAIVWNGCRSAPVERSVKGLSRLRRRAERAIDGSFAGASGPPFQIMAACA